MSSKYEDHPLAALLPLMSQTELGELSGDIYANGLRTPIVLLDNKILDGRNRYRACNMAGIEPKFQDFNGSGDPVAFIVSANVKRRHLTTSQRALIAAKLVNMPRGGDQTANLQSGKTSVKTAAKELEVSPREVATAKKVLETAPAKEIKKIEAGTKTVTRVAKEIKAKTEAKRVHLDKTGIAIPESILEDWNRAEAFSSVLHQVSKIKCLVEEGLKEKDFVLYAEVSNTTVATLKNAYGDLTQVIPYAVCTTCQGHERKKCTFCKGRGFLSKFKYETIVSAKARQVRERAAQK